MQAPDCSAFGFARKSTKMRISPTKMKSTQTGSNKTELPCRGGTWSKLCTRESENNFIGRIRGLQDPLWSLSTKILPALPYRDHECRSQEPPQGAQQCPPVFADTQRSKDQGISPLRTPTCHSQRPGRTCLQQTHSGEFRVPSPTSATTKCKIQKGLCLHSGVKKWFFWLLEQHILHFYHIYRRPNCLSVPGLQRDFPTQARAPPTILTPLLPEPWPLLFPPQHFPLSGSTVEPGGASHTWQGKAGK